MAAFPKPKSPYELLTKSDAAFGQLEYRVTDLIGFTLGGRFTADRKDYHFTWYPYEFFPTNVTNQVELLTPPDGAVLVGLPRSPIGQSLQRQGADGSAFVQGLLGVCELQPGRQGRRVQRAAVPDHHQ